MKNEVIIVKESSELIGAIESIKVEELVFVRIDKKLLDKHNFIHVRDKEYEVEVQGNRFNILVIEESDWYHFLYATTSTGKHKNTFYLAWFYFEGRCGCHEVYIKKEGSNAKIDEE